MTASYTGLWNDAPNAHQVIVFHSTESSSGRGTRNYVQRTQAGSYQDLIDLDGFLMLLVPEDKQAWAAMATGNRIGLHICLTGYASWGRDKWLSYPKMLEQAAQVIAKWSVKYGIPLKKINGAHVRSGARGVCFHKDISDAFRESDHTDPGPNFPIDVVLRRANEIVDGVGIPPDVADALRNAATQLWTWPQLGGRSFVDALVAVLNDVERRADGRY